MKIQTEEEYVYIPIVEGFENQAGFPVCMRTPVPSQSESKPQVIRGSYDRIGDIAIIKIRDWKRALSLSRSLIESSAGITTVFQDSGLEGEFRVRKLELLQGDGHTETEYQENGARFILDVSEVYFSPRLATERQRVASSVRDSEKIVDMFAGIGPFGIAIARKRNVTVHAMDSNPKAIEYMKKSIELNKLDGEVRPLLGDAETLSESFKNMDRIIMNLPHGGTRYLSAAHRMLRDGGIVHFYLIGDVGSVEAAMEACREAGFDLEDKRIVHGYSPGQDMVMLLLKKHDKIFSFDTAYKT